MLPFLSAAGPSVKAKPEASFLALASRETGELLHEQNMYKLKKATIFIKTRLFFLIDIEK